MYEFHGKILLSLTRMAGHSLLLGSLDLTEADSDDGDVAGVLRRGSRTYRSDSLDVDLRRSFTVRNLNELVYLSGLLNLATERGRPRGISFIFRYI